MATAYTDAHRLFAQAFLSNKSLSDHAARDLHTRCCTATNERNDAAQFASFLAAVNAKLNLLDMEVRSGPSDAMQGGVAWALVNTNGDAVAQLATTYTPDEIAAFKKLLELIVLADDEVFYVTSKMASVEICKTKQMTRLASEQLLDQFVRDGWLHSQDGRFSLTVRTILELQLYLKNEFEDRIKDCEVCKQIVTRFGEGCADDECQTRIHRHCANNYFRNREEKQCPTCNSSWAGE